ncbi:uncharacterized protein METZ01_LOCUS268477 [marine metagenome]|uniref:Uncharacterized protein n=1 Tax=marine metagenome TaxID=408172 RepID=A0A382JWM5_9ZZZZ
MVKKYSAILLFFINSSDSSSQIEYSATIQPIFNNHCCMPES